MKRKSSNSEMENNRESLAAIRTRVKYQGRLTAAVGLILCLGLCVIGLNVYNLRSLRETNSRIRHNQREETLVNDEKRADVAAGAVQTSDVKKVHSVCIYSRQKSHLNHVIAVFERLGYDTSAKKEDNWDVMWSHEYPFGQLGGLLSEMKATQKVNHWPGSGYLTMKGNLATSKLKSTPLGFRIPKEIKEFRAEAKNHPDKLWVQKSNNHRGVRIKKIEEMYLLDVPYDAGVFVQEFVSNPLLIDGRKFDIGIYTVITSIDPLRVYIYEDEFLLRFCSQPYHPLDVIEVTKYVVTDDYTPTWQIQSLVSLYNDYHYSHKQALFTYMRKHGHDPDKVWTAVKESIREAIVSKEPDFKKSLQHFTSNRNFFELVRFDFVIDENLKIWLMEVNMSPNLSSEHFPPNKWMYEQVIYNSLRLVGVGRMTHSNIPDVSRDEKEMRVNSRDIQIAPEHCTADGCTKLDDCKKLICKMCQLCRTASLSNTLKDAFLEHVNRGNFRRVLPHPLDTTPSSMDAKEDEQLSENNKLMVMWFRAKCRLDVSWCH
ncbi:probable tubulin polyglutamylase ttll-15 [Corticium candelabrum]|uniref:probable tubulin polyglutamylase ttll-15 n=1 Tax=Corticium candelabrum TaxID=121492 RepID=UPI002E268282|nr:probable tubulin polyglutamylase ttll-15 [Corticium candelabrum]XP_062503754.1 probable tubulin polyglutamylase ttll-15 [Corticium candelabrum]